jgi:hypothetical protein
MRLSTLRYQGGLFGRYGAAAKAHGWNRGARQADRINSLITAETNFIVGGINIYTIAKRAPT